jgi:hypothetical protein
MLQESPTKTSLASIGEEIGLELGAQMVKSFDCKHPDDVKSYLIGREIIEKILAQPGCVGLKFYNALNEVGEKTLVYLGVDANGKPIVEYTIINVAGLLSTEKGIVADRIVTQPGGFDWWSWLFD